MVMSVPPITIGSKLSLEVVPKDWLYQFLHKILDPVLLTVVPEKVTVEPVWRAMRSMVELAGAEMLSRTMLVHDLTTEVICAYSVAVQAVPYPPAAPGALVTFATDLEECFAITKGAIVVRKSKERIMTNTAK
jgi:hypothetical protein